ncbi:MAG: hypothetical protein JNK46_14770 [Methylobacteriaceae bacterium]|nr:hypothetical protein [Methylobacteriaceae bacterium]
MSAADHSPLRAGFAQADITPERATPLSGFASRDGLAEGTLDPLTARALWLDDGAKQTAMLALDLIGPPDGLAGALRARFPELGDRLVVAATHTHAGPPVLARAMLGAPPPGYLEHVAQRAAAALEAARAAARPVALRRGAARTQGVAHNRRDPHGPVDPHVDVVTFAATGAAPIVWLNFACHPVVLGPETLRYSADFPGVARRRVEAMLGARVIYTTGCAGEINLGHSALDSIRKIGMERRTPAEAERIGGIVAEAALAAMAGLAPVDDAERGLGGGSVALPARIVAPDAAMRDAIERAALATLGDAAATRGDRAMAAIDRAWLATPRPAIADLRVTALTIGALQAAFLPGEIFVETALALKRRAPGVIVVGYADSNPGYIPPAGARGGYEVDVAWRPYGAPGPFAPGMAEALAEAAAALLAASG